MKLTTSSWSKFFKKGRLDPFWFWTEDEKFLCHCILNSFEQIVQMPKVNYPEIAIKKGDGVTVAERYLTRRCRDSFLSMWSYPNVFRDQGKRTSGADGKEVCDLLVVFEQHLIIFSDKNCAFPVGENATLNWTRWYRKAVLQALNQIRGAERWLLHHQDRIFLDKCCAVKFPISLPFSTDAKVHRIVVAHGASTICREKMGGSGSLMISNDVTHEEQIDQNQSMPFTVGVFSEAGEFVHVLDDTAFDILLTSRDTISDFIHYLEAKEQLLRGPTKVMAAGEEELLAGYMLNLNPNGKHAFPTIERNVSGVSIPEGGWEVFQNSKERANQVEADRVSYLWDQLIEKFVGHIFDGTSQYLSHPNIRQQEELIRVLAKESRTRRRYLSQSLLDFIQNVPRGNRATRTVKSGAGETTYVFLVLPRVNADGSEEKYRTVRRQLLTDYCFITKLKVPDAKFIVGIATEPYSSPERSEDLIVMDSGTWTEVDRDNAIAVRNQLSEQGLLSQHVMSHGKTFEFPQDNGRLKYTRFKGKDRNLLCPCGTGLKYKKCCGRTSL